MVGHHVSLSMLVAIDSLCGGEWIYSTYCTVACGYDILRIRRRRHLSADWHLVCGVIDLEICLRDIFSATACSRCEYNTMDEYTLLSRQH